MTDAYLDREHWSKFASEWIAWASAPGSDVFWAYREALLAFIGQGAGKALEVGCGEGRVSRVVKECGYRVTATDPVAAFITAAARARSAEEYAVAAAGHLPFDDGSFDLVVAYNMLMDVENVPAAVKEMRRVLRSSGTLMVSLVHPFADRGRFEGPEPEAPFVLQRSYFGRERFEGVEERNGLKMHFAGWSQPLQDYMAALEGAGLAVASLREPVPDIRNLKAKGLEHWHRMPLFLWLKARRLP